MRLIDARLLLMLLLPCFALLFIGCGEAKFKVSGTIAGAEDENLVLERMDFRGEWIPIDSVRTDTDGSYEFSFPAPQYPEVYRINLENEYIYFPIDSVEHIQASSRKKAFAESFTLSGSPQAEQMMHFEKDVRRIEQLANVDSTAQFRKVVWERYLNNSKGSALSYYILNRRIGTEYLIDYTDPLYSAVANQFQTHRPADPRTVALVERAKQGQAERRRRAGQTRVVEAREIALIDIALRDKDGKDVRLSEKVGKGRPVIVAFGGMTLENAPAINRELKAIYDAGIADVFQVCYDADQLSWKTAAQPLPWTVVYDPDGTASRNIMSYNVQSLPKFYVYDRAGELHRESTTDVAALHRIVANL